MPVIISVRSPASNTPTTRFCPSPFPYMSAMAPSPAPRGGRDDGGIGCPFDVLILTHPAPPPGGGDRSATTPPALPIRCVPRRTVSTSDPPGVRLGSGGGTLHAIDVALSRTTPTSTAPTVLVVHAGGESSRCSASRLLGKAFQGLPSSSGPSSVLGRAVESACALAALPAGSAVVCAGDVLLSLPGLQELRLGDADV